MLRCLFFQAWGSLASLKSQTRDPQLKVPPGGLVLKIFTSWKNSSTSTGLEPANLGSRSPRPPRPTLLILLLDIIHFYKCFPRVLIRRNFNAIWIIVSSLLNSIWMLMQQCRMLLNMPHDKSTWHTDLLCHKCIYKLVYYTKKTGNTS